MEDLSVRLSGGYASIPTSHLPGSVPAAVDDKRQAPQFGEANLQTFPPNNGQGKTWGYQTTAHYDEDSSSRPAIGSEDSGQPPNNWSGFFNIASYQPYFNVDTYDVAQRIILSMYPHRAEFFQTIASNPDMYGPVWISTTLVFVVTILGNYASYLSFTPSSTQKQWVYDINYINVAAVVFYAYACLVPAACYFLLLYLAVPSSFVEIWCLYGYSMFIFIPASFLLIIPVEIVKWIIILLAGLESALFVASNIHSHVANITDKWTIVVASAFGVQLILALVIKLCFFV